MDDKPTIEYHPFGTITLNFDEQAVKLRRCRLGDLQYAKDLLEEMRDTRADERQAWVDEVNDLRAGVGEYSAELSDSEKADLRTMIDRMNELAVLLDDERVEIVYGFLSNVAKRMGDNPTPPKEEWPLDFFAASVPNDVISHWQSRPLASGRTSPNGTIREAATSTPSPPDPSYPPAQLPQ